MELEFLEGDTPDLSDLRTEMHLVGIASAAAAFLSTKLFITTDSLLLEMGLFLAIFTPLLYAIEMGIDDLRETEIGFLGI